MGRADSESSVHDDQMQTRIDRLECDVRRLLDSLDTMAFGQHAQSVTMASRDRWIGHGVGSPSFGNHGFFPQQLGFEPRPGSALPRSFTEGRARFVRDLIRQRRQREHHFPADMFADPAWDMMLDLYAAHYEQRSVSVSSLCIAAAVPATTALRWLKMLTDDGWFVRTNDPADGRRIYVHLSDDTRLRLDEYFNNLES